MKQISISGDFLKAKIFFLIMFLIFMAAIPAVALNNTSAHKADKHYQTADTAENNAETYLPVYEVCRNCDEKTSDEAVKALSVLMNNNYKIKPEEFNTDEYNSNNELFKKVLKIYNSVKEIKILYKNKIMYIPYSVCSNGITTYNKDYPYIHQTASPFDCFSDKYSYDNSCTGVSIEGLKYLCQNGMDYKNALKWYLSGFEIK